jgi:hypothetical protein
LAVTRLAHVGVGRGWHTRSFWLETGGGTCAEWWLRTPSSLDGVSVAQGERR